MLNPLVSIGLPVYNGEKYIAKAIDSIINQTYQNIELIISDNASTDLTIKICEDYAKKDSRITLHCQQENIGASRNHNYVFYLAQGEYFKWAAHDDFIAPNFIEICIEYLEKHSDVVLCFSQTQIIDSHNQKMGRFGYSLQKNLSNLEYKRFGELLASDIWNIELFGVMRTKTLQQTILFPSYIASDRILRAQLGLLGKFYEIPEELFFSRDHAGRSTREFPAHHQRAKWFDTKKFGESSTSLANIY